jgi:hypothetical protein
MVASLDSKISDFNSGISNEEETMISQDNKIADSHIIIKNSYECLPVEAEASLVEINNKKVTSLRTLSIDQVI